MFNVHCTLLLYFDFKKHKKSQNDFLIDILNVLNVYNVQSFEYHKPNHCDRFSSGIEDNPTIFYQLIRGSTDQVEWLDFCFFLNMYLLHSLHIPSGIYILSISPIVQIESLNHKKIHKNREEFHYILEGGGNFSGWPEYIPLYSI